MKRLVFVVARGRDEYAQMALGLARSLMLLNDENPRAVMTDIPGIDWGRYFDLVVPPPGPRSALDKLTACEVTDADRVLSLDVDMLAFKRLDPIFEYCQGKPFAVQGFWDSEGTFHKKPVEEILRQYGLPGPCFPRFNGGMAYYERGPKWDELLAAMRRAEADYEALGFDPFRGGKSEEVCMLDAMLRTGYVELIPPRLQFQHSCSGLVSRLWLDVSRMECKCVCKADKLEYAEPILFHAWRYKDFTVYWNELRKLRRFEEIADGNRREFVPRLQRLRRSIERRWMKHVRRWR
ncbi:MAG: hypothetical protein LDL56_09305 [Armatimonadetes bacterium]|nr:hypothetical protein [Armatimonadota bacterium]MCA1997411.1 hypothetical protein [Armatimonadota bacterium]